ncbi:glycosyltransferase [Haliea sp. E17]|uniref:glycosyltransferase n=1 Tax=Haliea sp. E17 TaxID=3401576 RepID=UPI003AAFAC22
MTAANLLAVPRIAICVCTHGRSRQLAGLLDVLSAIDLEEYPPERVELIVIDNRPGRETRELCERMAPSLPIVLHYAEEPQPGLTYARNRAVAVALARNADFVAFIDDDDRPRPDWLLRLLEQQSTSGADLVFGSWVLDADLPPWVRESGIFRSPDKPKRNKERRYGLPHFASGCNLLAGREILERVGAAGPVFDHHFRFSGGEDKDFFLRAHRLGATLACAERSIIQRSHDCERYSLRGLLRRGMKNGCSQINLAMVHGDRRRRLRLLGAACLKFLVSLVLLPFSVFSPNQFRHHLYRLAKSWGIIYTSLSGRGLNYYSR